MKSLFLLQKEDFDHIGIMNLMMNTLVERKLKISAEIKILLKFDCFDRSKVVLGNQKLTNLLKFNFQDKKNIL